jgi:hypothetical protein
MSICGMGMLCDRISLFEWQDIGREYLDWFIGGNGFCGTRGENNITYKTEIYILSYQWYQVGVV